MTRQVRLGPASSLSERSWRQALAPGLFTQCIVIGALALVSSSNGSSDRLCYHYESTSWLVPLVLAV